MADSPDSSVKYKQKRCTQRRRDHSPFRPPTLEECIRNSSPPAYSVEENSVGEWVNSRLNVKWPQPVYEGDIKRYRYLQSNGSEPRTKECSARSDYSGRRDKRRSRKSKRERRERKDRDESSSKSESRSSAKKFYDDQYVSLNSTSDAEDRSESAKSVRSSTRERKRMEVQTSPQMTRRSMTSEYEDERGGKRIDSAVFDTKKDLIKYKNSGDILKPKKSRKKRRERNTVTTEVTIGLGGQKQDSEVYDIKEYSRYYVGVRSKRSVEKMVKPGEFVIYYEKPSIGQMPLTIDLKLAYMSSESKVYHYPIQCFEGSDRSKQFVVMQNNNDGKMFPSILSLIKHYSVYAVADPKTDRYETFAVSD